MSSHKSRLDSLISDLCPSGVEFLEVGKVMRRHNGTKITATQMKVLHKNGASVKIFAGGKTYAQVDFSDIPKNNIYQIPSVIVKSRGVIEFEYYDKPFTHKNEFWSYFSDNDNINIKFVFYYLKEKEPYFQKLASKMQMPQISLPDTQKFKIPLPPLPIQQEIVRILDTFTNLEAELEAELEARKKQYEYYSSKLLTSSIAKQNIMLENIATYSTSRVGANKIDHERYVGVDNLLQNRKGKTTSSYVPTTGKLAKYEIDDILIGNIRPYLKKIWHATNAGGTSGDVLVIRIKEDKKGLVFPRYLYHLLASNDFFDYDMQHAKGAKMPRGDKSAVMNYKVFIPEYKTQMQIANTLDKFDALVNDISIGLPAELAARRQQYEYYRDTLLTFKERTTPLP